jgi:rhodanese-related sulfurtransferase
MTSISTPEEVKAAEKQPGAVFLDVRGADEVKAECLQARPFKHATCTLDDCSELMNKAETLLSDKHGEMGHTELYEFS